MRTIHLDEQASRPPLTRILSVSVGGNSSAEPCTSDTMLLAWRASIGHSGRCCRPMDLHVGVPSAGKNVRQRIIATVGL